MRPPTPDDGGFLDDEGVFHETLTDFVRSQLGWCGCGPSDDAMVLVRDVLTLLDERSHRNRAGEQGAWKEVTRRLDLIVPDSTLGYVLLYALDAVGWLEHGTGIRGSWLTPDGELALRLLNEEATVPEDIA